MKTHLILLRGINVSGQKKIKMEDLRKLLKAAGFEDIQTYIQSGNIILKSDLEQDEIEIKIKTAILKKYKFDVDVIITNKRYLKKVLSNNPFLKKDNENKLYVTFLASKPAKENIERLTKYSFPSEEYALKGDYLYMHFPNGAGRAKLNNNFIESKLKITASSRNWRTVNILYEMM